MTQILILLGFLLILFLITKALLERWNFSPIAGYIVLGWALNAIGRYGSFLTGEMDTILFLLAKLGIILLLFHIGLETNLKGLVKFVGQAGFIALCNIVLSGLLGFLTSWAFGLSITTSLFIGIALTATSIGVSTASWKKEDLTEKKEGALLLNLVVIDDILAILMMALLFSLASQETLQMGLIGKELGFFLLKMGFFVTLCYAFAQFIEPLLMNKLIKYEKLPDSMLMIIGLGTIIAGIAALIHFSLAIGAYFAGIAFSRDKRAVRFEASMQTLLDLLTPFFFFYIGYEISLTSIGSLWPFFFVLLCVAICGKLFGTYIPARFTGIATQGALLMGLSTIPRAEISMIVMEHGLELGVISEPIYSVMALLALSTCVLTPLTLKKLKPLTI